MAVHQGSHNCEPSTEGENLYTPSEITRNITGRVLGTLHNLAQIKILGLCHNYPHVVSGLNSDSGVWGTSTGQRLQTHMKAFESTK